MMISRISCIGSSLLVLLIGGVIICSDAVDAADDDISTTTTTTTPTTTTTTATTKLAFGSCHKNKKATVPPIWDVIGREPDLDAWVWTGDAMYPSRIDPVTGEKRRGPASPLLLQQGFNDLKTNDTIGYKRNILEYDNYNSNNNNKNKKLKVYGVWDDHDFGGNDMGKKMKQKMERKEIFWDFLEYDNNNNNTNDENPSFAQQQQRDGMYHSVDITPDLQLILLDTRWFRDDHCIPSAAHALPMGNAIACATRWLTAGLYPYVNRLLSWILWGGTGSDSCENRTILGEEQWEWLEETLLLLDDNKSSSRRSKVHVIVSSVQVWSTNPAMEGWGHFPSEQKRLYDLLERHYQQSPTSPVIFLSGDVHHAEVLMNFDGNSNDNNNDKKTKRMSGLLEVTSSGLTHHCGQPFGYGLLCRPILERFHEHRGDVKDYYIGLNYGVLTMNETAVTVEVKDANGETQLQVTQTLNDEPLSMPPFAEVPRATNGHMLPWLRGVLLAVFITFGLTRRMNRRRGKRVGKR